MPVGAAPAGEGHSPESVQAQAQPGPGVDTEAGGVEACEGSPGEGQPGGGEGPLEPIGEERGLEGTPV